MVFCNAFVMPDAEKQVKAAPHYEKIPTFAWLLPT